MAGLIPSAAEALQAWGARVRANRDQAERRREGTERSDFYAPVASAFRADPRRTDEPALDLLRLMVGSEDTVLDIGAGGGRYALPLALAAKEVIALDPSPGMVAVLRQGMAEHGIRNVRIVESRWPMAEALRADVALISHVGYDIEDIGPFLDAMEAASPRCIALLLGEAPASVAKPFWPPIHGEARALLPALPEFLALLLARGRFFEVRRAGVRPPPVYRDVDAALGFLRQQLFIQPGGSKDKKLLELLEASRTPEGVAVAGAAVPLGLVTWSIGP